MQLWVASAFGLLILLYLMVLLSNLPGSYMHSKPRRSRFWLVISWMDHHPSIVGWYYCCFCLTDRSLVLSLASLQQFARMQYPLVSLLALRLLVKRRSTFWNLFQGCQVASCGIHRKRVNATSASVFAQHFCSQRFHYQCILLLMPSLSFVETKLSYEFFRSICRSMGRQMNHLALLSSSHCPHGEILPLLKCHLQLHWDDLLDPLQVSVCSPSLFVTGIRESRRSLLLLSC